MAPNKNKRQQSVTLVDVATRAHVSIKTVSRVINNEGPVSTATRERVLKAIKELNYYPNRAARSLASSRSRVIGLLVPSIANPFFPFIILGVTRVMHEHSYDVLVYNTDIAPDRSRKGLKLLAENHVDGVIVCSVPGIPDDELGALINKHQAAVLINMVLPGNNAGVVRVDDAHGVKALVEHVVAAGRKTLAFVTNPTDKFSTRERLNAFREALRSHHLPVDEALIVRTPNESEKVYAATQALLQTRPDVDAIICYNDMMAASVLRVCMEMGINVPEQVAVTGFDNIPLTDLLKQSLTTMHVPKLELGIKAAELLLDRLNGDSTVGEIVITPELVIRESTPNAPGPRGPQPSSGW